MGSVADMMWGQFVYNLHLRYLAAGLIQNDLLKYFEVAINKHVLLLVQ